MAYETEFVGDEFVEISTEDPDVRAQLERHPAAQLIEGGGEGAKFRMRREQFELHFPPARL